MSKILIVEDDPNLRLNLGRILARGGHEVRMAVEGCEALGAASYSPASGEKR
jgi:DNA-binding NtrC family response regulator